MLWAARRPEVWSPPPWSRLAPEEVSGRSRCRPQLRQGWWGLSTVSSWGSDLEGLAGLSGGLAHSGFSSEACWSAVTMEPMEKPS